jgi:hypothetical protein
MLPLFFKTAICQYAGLTSDDHEVVFNTLDSIVQARDVRAIPTLHELISTRTPYIQLEFLRTLYALSDTELNEYCFEFINRAGNFGTHEYRYDPLEARLRATFILMENGNFSTVNYVWDFIDREKPNLPRTTHSLYLYLPIIAENLPQYRSKLWDELVFVYQNSTDETTRYYAIYRLLEIFKEETVPILLTAFTGDEYGSTRSFALRNLIVYQYSELNALLKERLPADPSNGMRLFIADTLLKIYGSPSDLKYVMEYIPHEPVENARSLMGFYVSRFIPPRPNEPITASAMLFTLKDYNRDCYEYRWIRRDDVYNEIDREIRNTIEDIENGFAEQACERLRRFNEMVENYYREEIITTEGYKFLKYHIQYIKEKIAVEYHVECR